MTSDIIWHRHHIVPKHAGGDDSPSNILKCNIAMHAFMHEQRYREFGDKYDKLAADGLRGIIPRQELIRQINSESSKRMWKEASPEKRERMLSGTAKLVEYTKTEEHRRKTSIKSSTPEHLAHLANLRTTENQSNAGKAAAAKQMYDVECPHCNKIGKYNGMKAWHFDRCKHKEKQ